MVAFRKNHEYLETRKIAVVTFKFEHGGFTIE